MRALVSVPAVMGLWVTAAWRLRRARRGLPDKTLLVTMLGLACAFTLDQPAVAAAVALPSMPNAAYLAKHCCVLAAAAAGRETLRLHLYEQEQALRGVQVRAFLALGAILALCALFATSPTAAGHTSSLTVTTATDGHMLFYWLVYSLFLGAVLAAICRVTARFARLTDPSPLRTTFGLLSVATGVGVLYVADKVSFIGLRLSGARNGWYVGHYDPVSTELMSLSALLLILGLTWPYLVRLPVLRHVGDYRALQLLHPLWRRMYDATPAIALAPPTGARDARPWPRDVAYYLQRRVVEIQDGALALRPYLDPQHMTQAARLTPDWSVPAQDAALVADAVALELARRAKMARRRPREGIEAPAPGPGDLAGEIRALSKLASHLATVDAIATRIQAEQGAHAR